MKNNLKFTEKDTITVPVPYIYGFGFLAILTLVGSYYYGKSQSS